MRVLVTGSAEGLGHATADTLPAAGRDVVVHVRNRDRLAAVRGLLERGATVGVGDLAHLDQAREVAAQANASGRMDAVIHNAGVYTGPAVLPVNVMAPYALTLLMHRPDRLVYLSSGAHRGGRPHLAGLDWRGGRVSCSYSDSKLFLTAFTLALARLWPDVHSNAVDPGWVPTRMGGPNAPDDLRLGHVTQEWLATSDDQEALTSGGYWHHRHRSQPHPSAQDERVQAELIDALAGFTDLPLG